MKAINTTVQFTTDYGKNVEVNLWRDSYGEITVNYVSINQTRYNGKHIRTEWRENVVIGYAQQFVDLHEYFADELAERELHHCQDNF